MKINKPMKITIKLKRKDDYLKIEDKLMTIQKRMSAIMVLIVQWVLFEITFECKRWQFNNLSDEIHLWISHLSEIAQKKNSFSNLKQKQIFPFPFH